jgi:hypothetical protein
MTASEAARLTARGGVLTTVTAKSMAPTPISSPGHVHPGVLRMAGRGLDHARVYGNGRYLGPTRDRHPMRSRQCVLGSDPRAVASRLLCLGDPDPAPPGEAVTRCSCGVRAKTPKSGADQSTPDRVPEWTPTAVARAGRNDIAEDRNSACTFDRSC